MEAAARGTSPPLLRVGAAAHGTRVRLGVGGQMRGSPRSPRSPRQSPRHAAAPRGVGPRLSSGTELLGSGCRPADVRLSCRRGRGGGCGSGPGLSCRMRRTRTRAGWCSRHRGPWVSPPPHRASHSAWVQTRALEVEYQEKLLVPQLGTFWNLFGGQFAHGSPDTGRRASGAQCPATAWLLSDRSCCWPPSLCLGNRGSQKGREVGWLFCKDRRSTGPVVTRDVAAQSGWHLVSGHAGGARLLVLTFVCRAVQREGLGAPSRTVARSPPMGTATEPA